MVEIVSKNNALWWVIAIIVILIIVGVVIYILYRNRNIVIVDQNRERPSVRSELALNRERQNLREDLAQNRARRNWDIGLNNVETPNLRAELVQNGGGTPIVRLERAQNNNDTNVRAELAQNNLQRGSILRRQNNA